MTESKKEVYACMLTKKINELETNKTCCWTKQRDGKEDW